MAGQPNGCKSKIKNQTQKTPGGRRICLSVEAGWRLLSWLLPAKSQPDIDCKKLEEVLKGFRRDGRRGVGLGLVLLPLRVHLLCGSVYRKLGCQVVVMMVLRYATGFW